MVFCLAGALIMSCNPVEDNVEKSAEGYNAEYFQPGIGFFMSRIQVFHEKLGLSGEHENWDLANFYIHELEETVEELEMAKKGRDELKLLFTLTQQIELIEKAVDNKDFVAFKDSYLQLTSTCNSCHVAAGYDYIVIKEPTENNFSNQDFSKKPQAISLTK